MKTPEIRPNMNGSQKAPPDASGAFPIPPKLETPSSLVRARGRTEFLADPPARSLRAILYSLSRHEWGEAPMTRWLWMGLIVLGGLWAIWLQPRWLGIAVALVAVFALFLTLAVLRRGDFVRFEEETVPSVTPEPLTANDKLAVYATGRFMVEGQYRRFTYLPGYFRTFATREHAVLSLARDRRFLKVGRWPALDVGMWYIFCTGSLIDRVRYGQLHFERQPRAAIAIDYQLTMPASGRLSGEKTVTETIYLACTSEADTQRLLADLLVEMSAVAPAAQNLETR